MPAPSNALHSAATPRWGTPVDLVERARHVMGSIDLDPASSYDFNKVVQASRYYSPERSEDGLRLTWFGHVFCNPPGGLVKEFWRKAMDEKWGSHGNRTDTVTQVIWVGFSLEQLALLANETFHPMDFSFCVLRKRLRFTRHDGYSGSPSHSNYICGVGVNHKLFTEEFGPLGRIYAPNRNT